MGAAMSIDQALLETLDGIYAAASDPSLWDDVTGRVMRALDSQAASFCVIDASDQPRMAAFCYINEEKRMVDYARFMHEYLVDGVVEQDPTVRHIVAHPSQRLVRDSAILAEAEKDRHFYYNWHASFSDTRHRMAGMVSPAAHLQSGVTLHRTRQLGDFSDDQVAKFNFLLPHIERSVRLSFQLGTLGALQQAGEAMLDASKRGILFLDAKGRVLFANRAAAAIAAAADGVLLSSRGLALLKPQDDQKLRQLIAAALAPGDGMARDSAAGDGLMRAARPSGKRPYALLVSPFRGEADVVAAARPALCISITDPDDDALLPEPALRRLFNLTRSEARLAARLARGEALMAAAAGIGISYATARTQLAAIFRKTGTSRQGELVRLLLSGMPAAPAPR
jgi:DNA-binding CsgD family transcriptional regulator/PAS domain-containing protein